jgi:hypothetical protein
VRTTLLPALASGQHVVAVRDHLELLVTGARKRPQLAPNDGRVATLVVTLPARFKGGDLIAASGVAGRRERFRHKDGKQPGVHAHWVAYLDECEAEVEQIRKGCRMDLYYAVHVRSFGHSGPKPDPLITPSDDFKAMVRLISSIVYHGD